MRRLLTATPLLNGSLLACSLLLAGCANQLSQRSEQEEVSSRRLLEQHLVIEAGDPELSEPRRRIRVLVARRFEVTPTEVDRHYLRYTPYQPWRELYEVPLGAAALLAGGAASVINLLTFNSLPETVTPGWINYGLAGINPGMNVESNGRARQVLASLDEIQGTARIEQSDQPWRGQPVHVRLGSQSFELNTDRNGELLLDLLAAPQTGTAATSILLQARDEAGAGEAEASLSLSPALQKLLRQALPLIHDDLEMQTPAQWAARISRLTSLGLELEARTLEQNLLELTQRDPQLQQELRSALLRQGR